MKGYRFYAEMPQDRKSKVKPDFFPWTVAALTTRANLGYRADIVAIYLDEWNRPIYSNAGYLEGATVAIEGNAFSYTTDGMSRDYMRKRCTRIPESLARKLSPQLFNYLGD